MCALVVGSGGQPGLGLMLSGRTELALHAITALCSAPKFGAVLGTAFICHSAEGCALLKACPPSGLLNANLRAAIHRCSEDFKMQLNCTVLEGRL